MTRIAGVQLILILMVIAGCGGDGSGAGGRHVTWQDDGTAKKALLTIATKAVSGTTDSREIIGTASDVGVAIYVSATAPLTAQTFDCSQLTSRTAASTFR